MPRGPVLAALLLLACTSAPAEPLAGPEHAASAPEATVQFEPPDLTRAGVTIADAFPPPHGAERVPADAWGRWVQQRTLRDAAEPVRTHDGRFVRDRGARVVELPLVPGDLQQCADAILRLRAEWLRETEQPVSFHATSGDPIPWARWEQGERPYAPGNAVLWRPGTQGGWESYLAAVFTWAGTASLQQYETRAATTPAPGMVLVQGGFPGHAVLLLDVATRGDQTWLLLGQSYMPAQDFHVDLGPHDGWWAWEEPLRTNTWSFGFADLRDWK